MCEITSSVAVTLPVCSGDDHDAVVQLVGGEQRRRSGRGCGRAAAPAGAVDAVLVGEDLVLLALDDLQVVHAPGEHAEQRELAAEEKGAAPRLNSLVRGFSRFIGMRRPTPPSAARAARGPAARRAPDRSADRQHQLQQQQRQLGISAPPKRGTRPPTPARCAAGAISANAHHIMPNEAPRKTLVLRNDGGVDEDEDERVDAERRSGQHVARAGRSRTPSTARIRSGRWTVQ